MPTFSAILGTLLDAAPTKLDWATTAINKLGPNRRIICRKDGVEFLNMAVTGQIHVVAGNIVGFGETSNRTLNLAADLATGVCTLRLQGNNEWVEYSLGLKGSGKEFTLPVNPDGSLFTSYRFMPDAGMQAPRMMDSGTGPLSPPMPHYTAEFEDWSTGSAVMAGVLTPDNRLINWVYDDAEMAQSQGDIRTQSSSNSVVLGDLEFGVLLWSMNGVGNSENSNAVDEILVIKKPKGSNWPNYPRWEGYIPNTSNTFAPPYKVRIKRDGVTVKVHEMRDGLPINHPSLNQSGDAAAVTAKPIRPFFNCAQVLPYRSYRHKMHTYAQKYYPGQLADVLRGSTCREKSSANPAYMMYSLQQQQNGINQWYGLPKWALPATQAAANSDVSLDPYLFNLSTGDPGYGNLPSGLTRVTGWGDEPAANGGHDHYTGPGGARVDRAALAGPIAIYMTDSAYVRPKNNDPILEMVEAWNANYCNIPWHFYADVTTGATIPVDEVFGAKGDDLLWTTGVDTYYGGGRTFTTNTVNTFSMGNGGQYLGAKLDKNGRMPFNGASVDALHCYKSPSMVAILFNSPMYAHLTKHAHIMNIMVRLGNVSARSNPRNYFLTREHAWRMKTYAEAWKLSTDHPWGIKRKWIMDMWQTEMETIYDTIYTDTVLLNKTDPYSVSLRNLGLPVAINSDGTGSAQLTQSLMYYMAGVLQIAKSIGAWDAIRGQSTKCRLAMDFIVQCMDKYSIDWVIQTNGQYDWYEYGAIYVPDSSAPGGQRIANNWGEVAVRRRASAPAGNDPYSGQWGTDWITEVGGARRGAADGSQHLRFQWACIRRDWITEAEVARGSVNTIADGIAKYQGFYDRTTAAVAAIVASDPSNAFAIRAADWSNRQPSYGVIKPPVAV